MPDIVVMNCPVCGMGYVPEIPDNVREHRKYHDRVINGMPAPPMKSDRIVWKEGDLRISVINKLSSLAQRRRAEEIARLANRDLKYDFLPYYASEPLDNQNVHAFLLYKRNRAIGLLVIEKRDYVWRTRWVDLDAGKEPEEIIAHSPIWSITTVWVLQRHRGARLGQTLVNVATAYIGCNIETIGWYTPFTKLGEALVRRCCPDVFYIAK